MRDDTDEITALRCALGIKLKELRTAAGIRQIDLADRSGRDRSTIARIEAGRRSASEEFWRAADHLLGAAGSLFATYVKLNESEVRVRTQGRRRIGNKKLKYQRSLRGWTQVDLAQRVNHSITTDDVDGQSLTVIDGDRIKAWENRHGTSKDYARHLCLVFNLKPSVLGLVKLSDDEFSPALDLERQSSLRHLSDLAELSRPPRTMKERQMVAAQDPKSRWAPALQAVGVPLDADQVDLLVGSRRREATPSPADPRAVTSYAAIVENQRTLYWTTAPEALLDAACAHLALGADMVRSDSADTPPLAGAVAECALLVARLAFFDLHGREEIARDAFAAASSSIGRAGDHDLAAAIAAHQAFIPGFAGDLAGAQPFLDAAELHWRNSSRSPLLRSWLHCVSAEIHAHAGEVAKSARHIQYASDYLTRPDDHVPAWLDYYDDARLAGFAGNADLLAGRNAQAAVWLQQALDDLGTDAAKQRSVLLLDLAAAYAPTEPDRALELALQACECLTQEYYQTAVDRLPAVRAALAGPSHYASQLTERARVLLQ